MSHWDQRRPSWKPSADVIFVPQAEFFAKPAETVRRAQDGRVVVVTSPAGEPRLIIPSRAEEPIDE